MRLPALDAGQPPDIGPGGWSSPGDISDEVAVAGRAYGYRDDGSFLETPVMWAPRRS
ncbi:hypothetical protein [Cellulomonas sp. NS3]|uniref:hypothetical protein n=1 Tax=Cellulomonas sp. NS3 TaxID=2973977 RepID=UPI00216352B2|nr:hypothetical protein [Cellulomonas sp. NS3]